MDIKSIFYQLFPIQDKMQSFLTKVDADEGTKVEFEKKIIELILMKFLEKIEQNMDETDKEYLERLVGEMQGQQSEEGVQRFQGIFQQPKFKSVYDSYLAEGIDALLMELEARSRQG